MLASCKLTRQAFHKFRSPICARSIGRMSDNVDLKYDSRQAVDPAEYASRWDRIWAAGLDKGQRWDCSDASPALLDLVTSGKLDVQGKRVLVPGCGRGYDVAAFAVAGAKAAVGLEISNIAATEAAAYLHGSLSASQEALSSTSIVEGDFFTWQHEDGAFDIGYDYTFGCAMHPTDRTKWAENWARVLLPGATLVTLIFPVDPSREPHIGPPFPISPELYQSLLPPAGFECLSIEKVPHALSHQGRQGLEYLGIWCRK